MNICIESSVLNHHRRSGLMTYTEGLVYGLFENDKRNDYSLAYYSLSRKEGDMPGPSGGNFHKEVLKVPDRDFWKRQSFIDKAVLPGFFRSRKVRVFHRPSGYTMPSVKGIFKVLTIHDLRTLTIGDNVWTQNIADYQRTVNSLDACVVVSECTKQDILKHFDMDEKKIKVIYLGADKRFQPSSREEIKKTLDKYQLKEPFLLSLGSVPRKNIDGIIRGFAAAKSRTSNILVLSCNFDKEKYSQLIEALGVSDRVRILDQLKDEEIVALYSSCRAFVFPSLYEGFGLPILEAFQCKAPVITSNVSSCPEVAGDAAILVDPLKPMEIAEAIDQLCQNEGLRQSLIQKGIERAKLFNWDKYAQEIQKIYELA
jgi:glycosyltransferase involved in cell wall biosynthesis